MTETNPSAPANAMPDATAPCAARGGLADEHAHLPRFVGTWNASVSLWFGPDATGAHTSRGVMVNDLELGGRYLTQTYTDKEGHFHGRGIFGYNTLDQRWEGFWIDDMTTFFQVEHGAYDHETDSWNMKGEMTEPGTKEPMTKRTVIRMLGDDEYIAETYFTTAGAPEFKGMEIRYTRA